MSVLPKAFQGREGEVVILRVVVVAIEHGGLLFDCEEAEGSKRKRRIETAKETIDCEL